MADVKRLHYYDQQFLREPDFTDEQKYHLDMRRRLNALVHGWGIVEGLQVVIKNSQTVTVQPGMALDADGREIVLGQAQDIAIPGGVTNGNKAFYVMIKYKLPEDLTDPPAPQDMITPADRTRVTERSEFPVPSVTAPADQSRTLRLGVALLNPSGNVTSIDNAVRQYVPRGHGGKFGIGTPDPVNKLDVEGGAVIGATYSGTSTAPFNGLLVEGNVGIGTTSPKNKLDVESGAVIGATYSGTNTAPTNGLLVEGNVGIGTADPKSKLDVEGGAVVGASYSGTNSAPANGLLVEGNVGIGTTSPQSKLHVSGGDIRWGNNSRLLTDQGGSIELGGDNATAGTGTPYIDFHYSGKTEDRNVRIINDGNGRLTLDAPVVSAAARLGIGTANPTDVVHVKSSTMGRVTIETQDDTYSGFRAKNAGADYFIGAGSTFFQVFDNVRNRLVLYIDAQGHMSLGTMGGTSSALGVGGDVYVTGDVTCARVLQGSDQRLKKDTREIDDALGRVLSLRGVSFEWKTDEGSDRAFPPGRHYGVIAQEVEPVFPELVVTGTDGEKAVSYTSLVPALIEAIKEQQTIISELQTKLETLSKRVEHLAEAVEKHPELAKRGRRNAVKR